MLNKKQLLSSWLNNLYEDKIIYEEKFIILAELSNVKISEDRFTADLNPLKSIYMPRYFKPHKIQETLDRTWEIGFTLDPELIDNIRFTEEGHRISSISFTIWTDPNLILKIERLLNAGSMEEIDKLLI